MNPASITFIIKYNLYLSVCRLSVNLRGAGAHEGKRAEHPGKSQQGPDKGQGAGSRQVRSLFGATEQEKGACSVATVPGSPSYYRHSPFAQPWTLVRDHLLWTIHVAEVTLGEF